MTSCMSIYGNLSAHQKATVGDTKMSVVGLDHLGWMLCDGRTLNVKDFYFLFSIIQYSFGGSGAQFKLPNPAGRIAGVIGGVVTVSTSVHAMGEVLGEETHTLTIAEMPTHNHTGTTDSTTVGINDPGHTHTGQTNENVDTPETEGVTNIGANSQVSGAGQRKLTFTTASSGTGITTQPHTHTFTTNNTGGSNAHNNMQPTLFMGNMFIYSGLPNLGTYPKTTGSYPYSTITAYTGRPNTIIL
jgi:microcystin-dependent protein